MQNELLQVGGAVALIALVVRELFAYLKSRNSTDGSMNDNIFKELQTMNNNHLHSIQEVIEKGNERLIDVTHSDNTRMIEILGEIRGNLNSRR
jgi:CRISPR/Cas system-associated protein endoribonuclease Cas2